MWWAMLVSLAAHAAQHTVAIEGMKFVPEVIEVETGDTITWINKDIVPHTATALSGAYNSKLIAPGNSWNFKVKRKGELPYKCDFHPMMKGILRVKE
jgi:plastocyanin